MILPVKQLVKIDKESFDELSSWLEFVNENKNNEAKIVVVGNKLDINENRAVEGGKGAIFADENEALFMEVSAKSGENVELLFHNTVLNILESKPPSPKRTSNGNLHNKRSSAVG